jgi:hypothetical protein
VSEIRRDCKGLAQKRVERCSLGRSLALPRTAGHIVGRALDIRLESKLSDAM